MSLASRPQRNACAKHDHPRGLLRARARARARTRARSMRFSAEQAARTRALSRLGKILGAIVAVVLLLPVSAGAQSPAERRKKILDKVGLQPKPKPKPKPDEPDDSSKDDDLEDLEPIEDEGEGPSPDGDSGSGSKGGTPGPSTSAPRVTFSGQIHGMLQSRCLPCHGPSGSAARTRLVLSGDLQEDHRASVRLVDRRAPEKSILVTKGIGVAHGGGASIPPDGAQHKRLVAWISGGAPLGGTQRAAPAPTPSPQPEAPPATADPRSGRAPSGASPGTAGPKPASPRAAGERGAPPSTSVQWSDPDAPAESDAPDLPSGPTFEPTVHRILVDRCQSCHAPGSPMAGGFVLNGDPGPDFETSLRFVTADQAAHSPLLTKAAGTAHGGGEILSSTSDDHAVILEWIEGGTPRRPAPRGPAAEADPDADPTIDVTTGASPPAEQGARLGDGTPLGDTPSRLPMTLPFHLRLNGKFDFSYERRDYQNHPFGPGRNAFRTYHHFLFLSRSGAKDPFGLNVELMTRAFYEFNARLFRKRKKFDLLVKAGKILVPFGNEPLFHTSYGGRAGFDQEILPVIWAQPGIAVNARVLAGPVTLSNDLYVVQGYGLRQPDAVLDLQGDFSPLEDVKPAIGDRVGGSLGPMTVWYSFLLNPLGHGRMLFMQAVDVELWRMHGVPVLEDVVVSFGGMRADVSGGESGGPGNDYYHFGSHASIGYFPIEYLYLQYRAGLRTHDNRRGLYWDETRADEQDRSSHNITIVGRYKGFYTALQFFWNLEKANEQHDDFMRFTVGYEF
jgi:hypothetical protein